MNPLKSLETIAGIGLFIFLIESLLAVAYITFWLIALVHCIKHHPEKDKMMWVLIIIFVPLFGTILYFTIGKQSNGSASATPIPPVIPQSYSNARVTIQPDPSFDLSAMHDEKQRAQAIMKALRAESERNRRQP